METPSVPSLKELERGERWRDFAFFAISPLPFSLVIASRPLLVNPYYQKQYGGGSFSLGFIACELLYSVVLALTVAVAVFGIWRALAGFGESGMARRVYLSHMLTDFQLLLADPSVLTKRLQTQIRDAQGAENLLKFLEILLKYRPEMISTDDLSKISSLSDWSDVMEVTVQDWDCDSIPFTRTQQVGSCVSFCRARSLARREIQRRQPHATRLLSTDG